MALTVLGQRACGHNCHTIIQIFGISQVAEEKQTIVSLVAANVGLAIIPRWASRLKVAGVRFVPLVVNEDIEILPLAAAWLRATRDPLREQLLAVLRLRLPRYAAKV